MRRTKRSSGHMGSEGRRLFNAWMDRIASRRSANNGVKAISSSAATVRATASPFRSSPRTTGLSGDRSRRGTASRTMRNGWTERGRSDVAMDEDELKELQDPNTWQDMEDDKRPPVKPSRVIVSVAFPRSDFDLVSEAADEHGMKMSEFVRNAAIERARATVAESVAVSLSGDV